MVSPDTANLPVNDLDSELVVSREIDLSIQAETINLIEEETFFDPVITQKQHVAKLGDLWCFEIIADRSQQLLARLISVFISLRIAVVELQQHRRRVLSLCQRRVCNGVARIIDRLVQP